MASPLWLGLITEGSVSATTRLFLGHQKTNEKHLIRDTQSLWSWFSSRRKVREGIHEYLELELGACDPEVILRNSKVHWIRKSTHGYLLDQAIKFMREKNDKGFIFQEPSEAHRVALAEILNVSAPCRESESAIMNEKLRDAMKPGRYESNPMSAITAPDFLALRKYVEEDTVLEQFCTNETVSDTGLHFSHVPDLERKLKHFLSRKLVDERLDALLQTFIPPDRLKPGLTKSEIKSLNYLFPNEYSRAHYIPQYRPLEMAALYRVHASNRFQSDSWYAKCLWGHLFMRMSLHPGYLLSIGQSWLSGMFQCDTVQALPQHLAMAAPVLIDSLPATTFHAQYALTDTKYTSWQQYPLCIPLLRVLPLVGSQIADDLVAELNVRKCWSSLNIPLLSRLDDPDVTHRIKCMMGALVTQNVESALEGAIEASKLMVTHEPSPTNDDQESMKTRALR